MEEILEIELFYLSSFIKNSSYLEDLLISFIYSKER